MGLFWRISCLSRRILRRGCLSTRKNRTYLPLGCLMSPSRSKGGGNMFAKTKLKNEPTRDASEENSSASEMCAAWLVRHACIHSFTTQRRVEAPQTSSLDFPCPRRFVFHHRHLQRSYTGRKIPWSAWRAGRRRSHPSVSKPS